MLYVVKTIMLILFFSYVKNYVFGPSQLVMYFHEYWIFAYELIKYIKNIYYNNFNSFLLY